MHVPGVVKGAVYDMARSDENTFGVRHKDVVNVVLEPRVCVESVRDNVAVTTRPTVTTGWDKHADGMRMRKTCAR